MHTFFLRFAPILLALTLMGSGLTSCTKCSSNQSSTGTSTGNSQIQDFPELKIETLKPGSGAAAASGKKVTVHYKGTFTDGRPFDSTEGRGPFSFTLGQGQVIPGWEKGVEGMLIGEKRRLSIPSAMAYGERGAGEIIPPNTPLVFELELLNVE